MYMILRRVGVSGRHGVERRFFLGFVVVGEFSSGMVHGIFIWAVFPDFFQFFFLATFVDISCCFFFSLVRYALMSNGWACCHLVLSPVFFFSLLVSCLSIPSYFILDSVI